MADEDGQSGQSAVDTASSPFVSKKKMRRDRARLREVKQGKKEPVKVHESSAPDPRPHALDHRPWYQRIYEDQYKKLLWIPLIILILALVQIGVQTATTGDFLHKGVSIKGGVTMTIPATAHDVDTLKNLLATTFPANDIEIKAISSAGKKTGLIIEADVTEEAQVQEFVNRVAQELNLEKDGYSTEIIGSSLGASFFKQTFTALILAFVFMAIVVLLYFRILIPSLAVISVAFADIVVTIAILNILGIKLSTGGIAALLMLVGYSVDSDILLAARVLHREGSVMESIYSAIKTGLTTTATTATAVIVGLLASDSDVLKQIMTIIFIGICVDTVFTWIQNTGLLRWYVERKEKQQQTV
ncbi:MAG: protein translocase subunit SecF [Candidatus Woesearchaeota archaeon]|nr:protein translocase subunit SecF [Candidatus Woesearchaeota archaeon]